MKTACEEYLEEHGINEKSSAKFGLKGDDFKLEIPVKDGDGKIVFIKQRRFTGKAKFRIPPGSETILFNSSILKQKLDYLVITAGEIDCIRLDQEGIPAISSTAGEGTFKKDWVDQVCKSNPNKELYLCEDNDGKNGPKLAKKTAAKFSKIKIIHFPEGIKDACEYLKFHTKEDFLKLIEQAEEFTAEQKSELQPNPFQINFFHPALTIDRNNREVMVGIPIITPSLDKNGKYQLDETILIISSKNEAWLLVPVEIEKRGLYPTTTPSFGTTEPRWSPDFMSSSEILENIRRSHHSDLGNRGITSPFIDIFLPIKNTFEKFLDFNNSGYSTLLAIWTMGTYLFPLFEAYPYLYLGGPKGSGKSKILEILSELVFNPVSSSNASTSSLFRSIESTLATILLDEGEMLTGREVNPDLRLLLNAGYKSSGIVTRTNPENLKVERFQVYSPKAIASINPLDSTLASRCIALVMLRTANKEKGRARVNERTLDGKLLRNLLYKWCLDHALEVANIFDEDKNLSELNNRSNELYLPLLAITAYIDKFVPSGEAKLLPVIQQLAEESITEEDLLDDWTLWVLEAIDREVTDFRPYLIKDIRTYISRARAQEGELLDDRLNNKWIGSCLKKLGFKRGKATNEGKTYFLKREQIESLKERYGLVMPPDSKVTMVTSETSEVSISKNKENQIVCPVCKGMTFYQNPSGVLTCSRCHPPIDGPNLKAWKEQNSL